MKENEDIESVVMEIFLVEAAEVMIEIIQIRNRKVGAYEIMCGGDELCQAQHNCDKITLDLFRRVSCAKITHT